MQLFSGKPWKFLDGFSPWEYRVSMIAFLLAAFIVGLLVVYGVPRVNTWVAKVPGTSNFVNNKVVQLLIVGLIVVLGLHIFLAIAGKVDAKL
jgi:phosphotransferase system  glucose/maltose/N-acetylglucosamine-specific IIC component